MAKNVFIVRQSREPVYCATNLLAAYNALKSFVTDKDKKEMLTYSQYWRRFGAGSKYEIFNAENGHFELMKMPLYKRYPDIQTSH